MQGWDYRDIEIKMAPIIDINMVIFSDVTGKKQFEKLIFQGKKEWKKHLTSLMTR